MGHVYPPIPVCPSPGFIKSAEEPKKDAGGRRKGNRRQMVSGVVEFGDGAPHAGVLDEVATVVGSVEQGLQGKVTEWSWQAAGMGTQEVDGRFGEEGLVGANYPQVVV